MPEVSEVSEVSEPRTSLWTERGRFSVRRLPVYQGQEGKVDVFNNGGKDETKYAVPFQLRLGTQLSEQGGPQLSFAADPNNPTRILIPDDIRRAGEQGFLDASRIVVLEQTGEGSAGELWVRVGSGNAPLEIREGDVTKQSLRSEDLIRNTLVIPLAGCKYALSVTGFNPATREVIVQKVLLPDEISGPDKITAPEITSSYEPSKIPSRFRHLGKSSYDMSKWFPHVLGPARRFPSAPLPNRPAVTTEVPSPASAGSFPDYTGVLTAHSRVPEATQVSEPAAEEDRVDPELSRRVRRLGNTNWGRALQAALLIALVAPIPRSGIASRNPEVASIQTPFAPPVIETNLQGQSTWGVFLHHLGRVDASAIESIIQVPDEVRSAWNAVREVEAQTGQNIDPGDPLLLDAIQAAINLFGEEGVKKLYENNVLRDIPRVNLGLRVSPFGELSSKFDDRFGMEIRDGVFAIDTLGMPQLENTIVSTLVLQTRNS